MTEPMTDSVPAATGSSGASNRHRPEAAAPAQARGAIIALAVSAIGTVGFVFGLRAALHIAPPERPAVVRDSATAAAAEAAADSARRGRTDQYRPPQTNEPDAYPRLR